MGKQSKKKGKVQDKKSHKAKVQQRRERVEEQILAANNTGIADADNSNSPRIDELTVLDGDIVWFTRAESYEYYNEHIENCNPNDYRGFVREIVVSDDEEDDGTTNNNSRSYQVQPISNLLRNDSTCVEINPDKYRYHYLRRDNENRWTTRFDVGDNVVCYTDRGWQAGTVQFLWPIWERRNNDDPIPIYKIVGHDLVGDEFQVAAPDDLDYCIQKHPTTFRYVVGDKIILNTRKMKLQQHGGFLDHNYLLEEWETGTITKVDILGMTKVDYYAVYQCTTKFSQEVYVVKDDDEHIATAVDREVGPRERLLAAIDQGCSYHHIDYLVKNFSMDVVPIKDMLLKRALDHGNFDALRWLETNNTGIEMAELKFDNGNNILHEMASSPQALQFFQGYLRHENSKSGDDDYYGTKETSLTRYDYPSRPPYEETNQSGETWLDVLIGSDNLKTIDFSLSLQDGLFGSILMMEYRRADKERISKVANIASGDSIKSLMVNQFTANCKINSQSSSLRYHYGDEIDETQFLEKESMFLFRGDGATKSAKILIRFVRQWGDQLDGLCLRHILQNVIENGFSHLYMSMVKADQSILNEPLQVYSSRETKNEFAEAELYKENDDDDTERGNTINDVASLAMAGKQHHHISASDGMHSTISSYLRYLHNLLGFGRRDESRQIVDFASLLASFKLWQQEEAEEASYELKQILEYQIGYLEDDTSLLGRCCILDFLMNEYGMRLPNALDAVRMRQCGVVRWMVRRSLLRLTDKALNDHNLNSPQGRKLSILGGQRIPKNITSGSLLAFACIEYDALQTLAWLVEDQKVPISMAIGGFNLLHACVYFGRTEALLWMSTQEGFNDLKSVLSTRKGFEKASPVHVAVSRGHTMLADMLLMTFGCPALDGLGRTPDMVALASQHKHVREWGEEKARPFALGKDVEKLVRCLSKKSYGAARKHLEATKCLSIKRWQDAGIDLCTESLPNGTCYRNIVLQCLRGHDKSFVLWVSHKVTSFQIDIGFELQALNLFWEKPRDDEFFLSYKFNQISIAEIQEIAVEDSEVSQWLSFSWENSPKIYDPKDSNPIVWSGLLDGEVALQFYKETSQIALCRGFLRHSERQGRLLLAKGMSAEAIKTLALIHNGAAERLAALGCETDNYFDDYKVFTRDRDQFINIKCHLYTDINYDENHTIVRHSQLCTLSGWDRSSLLQVLAIEGYDHLMFLCHRHGQGWTAAVEKEVIQMAAYFSHDEIVSFFLTAVGDHFHASHQERCQAAMMGAAEAGKENEFYRLLELCGQFQDPALGNAVEDKEQEEDDDGSKWRRLASLSLAACIVYGYLKAEAYPSDSHISYQAMMKKLVQTHGYSALSFLKATSLALNGFHPQPAPEVFEEFLHFLGTNLNLKPFGEAKRFLDQISASLFFGCYREGGADILTRWATALEYWGVDIQRINNNHRDRGKEEERALAAISSLQAKQRGSWAKLDIIKKGNCSLVDIKAAIEAGTLGIKTTDVGGLYLSHLCAAYNRVDVLKWLVATHPLTLDQLDHRNRTVLDVAKASKAGAAVAWIQERYAKSKISAFLGKHFRKSLALRRKARLISGATRLQALQRGKMTRKRFRGLLTMRMEESKRYSTIWIGVHQALANIDTNVPSWSSLRNLNENRLAKMDHLEDLLETGNRLDAATSTAVAVEDEQSDHDTTEEAGDGYNVESQCPGNNQDTTAASTSSGIERTKIQLSSDTVKWLRRSDGKFREFFVRRVKQLSAGDRSRILEKRLKGSTSIIYETYLEQKSGHRILWQYMSNDTIFIWYVAKHKNVSRLIRLIDDSQSRSARQRITASSLPELAKAGDLEKDEESHSVLLNPRGNVPLKVYKIDSSELEHIVHESWSPQLHLTEEERGIVEEPGTVLLLGRSGTGKTVCICNRMDLDRQHNVHNEEFTQLFVARSQRLANYVKETIGEHDRCTFSTFGRLVERLENELPKLESVRDLFLPSQKMDYARFKRDVCSGSTKESVNPMVAWTNIRSFLKGSMEALLEPNQIMSRESFLALGKRRCRLAAAEREAVHDVFLRYQKVMTGQNLWDSCDRIAALLKRMNVAQEEGHPSCDTVRRTKIYVDEIQDYTQGEILIFFQLSGPGQLFLAGDPAQSVVEGVEFRFEEIRSVGYHIAGRSHRDLIPQKPKTVTVNFRSHSGVLDAAAAILQRMFDAFPDSAKQLGKDRGLFTGPRPGVFSHMPPERLKELVLEKLNGIVLLTHDHSVSHWKRQLGGYQLVYGIRAAKGLEFKRVIVLDFFSELPREIQKPWRDLLLGRDVVNKPELEGQLKLLYTAVTRCIEQLFFAETSRSISGDAFVRWSTTTSVRSSTTAPLATRQNVDDVESMALTQDEWIASALENAELAEQQLEEGSDDNNDVLDASLSLLEKALFCFEQGKETGLAQKARAHRASLLFQREVVAFREGNEGRQIHSGSDGKGDHDRNHHYDASGMELQSADVLEQLLSENLLLEARRLMEVSILPCLVARFSQEKLENDVLSQLQWQE